MQDRTIHVPGICKLPFHTLDAAASSAASCQAGAQTVFNKLRSYNHCLCGHQQFFKTANCLCRYNSAVLLTQLKITTNAVQMYTSCFISLTCGRMISFLWSRRLNLLMPPNTSAIKWQKATKVASFVDFLNCFIQQYKLVTVNIDELNS